jgi:hypothetical protein
LTRGGDHSKDSINREVGTKINLRNLNLQASISLKLDFVIFIRIVDSVWVG